MEDSNYCSCGNAKYPDAATCNSCWNNQSRYNAPKDNNHCSCGRPKYSDAACCDACWNKGRLYDDGRG